MPTCTNHRNMNDNLRDMKSKLVMSTISIVSSPCEHNCNIACVGITRSRRLY